MLCQRDPRLFQCWEDQRGPGQNRHGTPPANRSALCQHLGDQLRNEPCQTCRGDVQVKVFACGIHGECTLGKELPHIACCLRCHYYEAHQTDESLPQHFY